MVNPKATPPVPPTVIVTVTPTGNGFVIKAQLAVHVTAATLLSSCPHYYSVLWAHAPPGRVQCGGAGVCDCTQCACTCLYEPEALPAEAQSHALHGQAS